MAIEHLNDLGSNQLLGRDMETVGVAPDGVVEPGSRIAEFSQQRAGGGGGLVAGEELPMRLGTRVRHAKFGEGTILRFEGQGDTRQVQVNFETVGLKTLMFELARLEQIS